MVATCIIFVPWMKQSEVAYPLGRLGCRYNVAALAVRVHPPIPEKLVLAQNKLSDGPGKHGGREPQRWTKDEVS